MIRGPAPITPLAACTFAMPIPCHGGIGIFFMLERRAYQASEIRAKGESTTIVGHAAVFNSLSEDLGGFKETIRPGAFAGSIARDDIRALWNHDANHVLGRNTANTLRLSEDDIGLAVEIDLPDTSNARDLMTWIRRRDVSQMSFGFIALRDDWRLEGGLVIRELIEAQLFDVSPVTYPAFPQTDVSARSRFAEKIATLAHRPLGPRVKLQKLKLALRDRP